MAIGRGKKERSTEDGAGLRAQGSGLRAQGQGSGFASRSPSEGWVLGAGLIKPCNSVKDPV